MTKKNNIETASDAATLFRAEIGVNCKFEGIYILPLEEDGTPLSNPILVSPITDTGIACIELGAIFAIAYRIDAKAIIVAHNHPSGDPRPSKADIEFTIIVKDMCEHLGNIEFIDHLIIGSPESAKGFGFVSISEIQTSKK